MIENAADDPPVEQPQAFVRAVRAALARHALTAAGFRGEIAGRGHPRYDALRAVYNGMIDRRPALIARCTDARDVAAAVGVARREGLPVSVYGGGHNVTGNAVRDDALTIDLRPMKSIEVDPEARVCRAEAGLTWGELDACTQRHGLAVTGGRVSTTGIGGLVAGRRLGLDRAQVRLRGRQPAVGRGRDRGRPHPDRISGMCLQGDDHRPLARNQPPDPVQGLAQMALALRARGRTASAAHHHPGAGRASAA